MKTLHLILAAIVIFGLVFTVSCDKDQQKNNLKAVSNFANNTGLVPLIEATKAKARYNQLAYVKLTKKKLVACQKFSNRYVTAIEMTNLNNPDKSLVWYCGYSHEVMYYFVNCGKNYGDLKRITQVDLHSLKGLQKGTRYEFAVDDYDTPPEWDCQFNSYPE